MASKIRNIAAVDRIARRPLDFVVQVQTVAAAEMDPHRFEGIVCVVFVLPVAVQNDRIPGICGGMTAVFDVGEGAADDVSNEKAVVIAADEMISVHAEKMPRTDRIEMKFFRNLRRGEKVQIGQIQNAVFSGFHIMPLS